MKPAGASAAVAAKLGRTPQSYEASPAPPDSIHEDLWYVSERDGTEMPIDDCVWIVFPDGLVARGIPVGNPINPPTPVDELRRRPMDLDDPEAPWNLDTVTRVEAESEVAASPLTLYPHRGEWWTCEEFTEWVSSVVGLYEAVEVHPMIVTEYTCGTRRWTKDQLRKDLFPAAALPDGGFEDWLSSALTSGELRSVEFLQYIAEGYGDENPDGEPSGVVMERRIVDASTPMERDPE
jgi:hypothetical protein